MVQRTTARNERGQVLVLTVISMTVLLALAALSVDASFMYDKRNRIYAAADAAAKSAALEIHRNPTLSNTALEVFVARELVALGITAGACGASGPGVAATCVDHPPTTGPFAGFTNYVEVSISQETETFFGRMLGGLSLSPGARAVAGEAISTDCIAALGPSSPGLQIAGTINAPGCTIVDNTALVNNGTIAAAIEVDAVTCSGGCGSPVKVNVPPAPDPLAGVPAPAPAGACLIAGVYNIPGSGFIPVGNYCGGWHIPTGATMSLIGGLGPYYIGGPITADPGVTLDNPDGLGVTIIIEAGGAVQLINNITFHDLGAPTIGATSGILLYQRPGNTNAATIGGPGSALTVSGVVYLPGSDVTIGTISPKDDCTLFVTKSLNLTGNATLANTCAAYGGSPLKTVAIAE